MSSESERKKVLGYLQANWNDVAPVKFPNQPFVEPADKFFCHVLLIKGIDERLNIGKTYKVRCWSDLQIDIYGPVDGGEARHNAVIDHVTSLFADRQMRTDGDNQLITFRQPKRQTFGPRDHYYRVTVRVPFYRDETRTAN